MRVITATEAARILKTSADTARNLGDRGKVEMIWTEGERPVRLFVLDSVRKLAEERTARKRTGKEGNGNSANDN